MLFIYLFFPQIKGKKVKNKALKRKSDGDGESPHKVQKTNKEKERSDEATVETIDAEEQEDSSGQEGPEAFDYEKADYSLFQKARNKVQKKQKIKEMFKGKVSPVIALPFVAQFVPQFVTVFKRSYFYQLHFGVYQQISEAYATSSSFICLLNAPSQN